MASTEKTALDLIDRIFRAAARREEWTSFCSALGTALGGAAVAINLEFPKPGEKGLAFSTGFDPAFRESFRSHYFALEPWEEPFARLPVGALAFGGHLVPDEVALRSEFYNDWMKPQGFLVGPYFTVAPSATSRSNVASMSSTSNQSVTAPGGSPGGLST